MAPARFTALSAILACTVLAIASECAAQGFPSRPIRFVVPYGAGAAPGGEPVIRPASPRSLGEVRETGAAPAR